MRKILKNNLKGFLIMSLIFSAATGWIFSGWPRIWNNPQFPPKIREARAAIALRGIPKIGGAPNGLNVTLTFDTGADAPQTGDVVIFFGGSGSDGAGTTKGPSTTGYTLIDITNGADVQVGAWYKVMGPTPDLTVVGLGGGDGGDAVAYGAYVIDGTTLDAAIFDQTATKVGQVTGVPNAPAIDTQTAGAMVIALAGGHLTDTTPGIITGYTNYLSTAPNDTDDITLVAATKIVSSPATEDPVAWSLWTSSNYIAITIALKPAVAPTVTTQAADPVGETTATCNGTITATGGANATAVGCEWDTDSGAPYANNPSTAGDYGAAPFTQSLTSLPSGTTIYARAFATNGAGTGYGSEVSFLTKPAAPTGVAATDGTYTDKVTITWTKSTGASDYHVWCDSTDLGSAGDVATFDDSGADAPTITAGSAVAGDGTNSSYVELSLSGTSANNGTSHTYKVVASNATGNSADSATDTGYRGVGSLTYQWQRSSADSDADYSNIDGATTAAYNDTGAPADGSGRYYKCILNATGAAEQISTADRGYRSVAVVSVTLDQENFDYGKVANNTASSTLTLWGGAGITATNGSAIADFYVYGANSTGSGAGWTLAGDTTGNNYIHKFCNDTDYDCTSPPTNYTALTTSPVLVKSSVAPSGTMVFQMEITTPTTPTDVSAQNAIVTIQASAP